MQFTFVDEGIDAVIIDDFYNDSEMSQLMHRLEELTPSMSADKDALEAAVDMNGNFITTKYGIWLNDYEDPFVSIPYSKFSSKEIADKFISFNSLYKILFNLNRRSTLISYYENAGYYSKHTDASVFTILNYFHKEPKQFSGGDVIIHSYDMSKKVVVEPRNNRVIVIPSCALHEVTQIQMTSKQLDGSGRYCCSIFLSEEYLKQGKL